MTLAVEVMPKAALRIGCPLTWLIVINASSTTSIVRQTYGIIAMTKEKPSLDEIGVSEGTDKSSLCHSYLAHYERFVCRWRDAPITLLEIGVYNGASLRTWRKYFSQARIVGIDIDPRCEQHATEGIEIFIGSQIDPLFLKSISKDMFHVIVDDGSHHADHIPFTLQNLFPAVVDGGCYIVEDLRAPSQTGESEYRKADSPRPSEMFAEHFKTVAVRDPSPYHIVEAFPGGVALWKRHRYDAAERIEKARSILYANEIVNPEAWYYFAALLRDSGRKDEGMEAIEHAILLGGVSPKYKMLKDSIM